MVMGINTITSISGVINAFYQFADGFALLKYNKSGAISSSITVFHLFQLPHPAYCITTFVALHSISAITGSTGLRVNPPDVYQLFSIIKIYPCED